MAKLMNTKDDELRPEYPADLMRSGVKGKYAARFRNQAHQQSSTVANAPQASDDQAFIDNVSDLTDE